MAVPFHLPGFLPEDGARLAEVLATPSLTGGEPVRRFEEEFARRLGAAHCVAVTSGTAALEAALVGLGVGEGREVITSGLTAVATLHAILRAGATPRVVDVDPETGLIDLDLMEAAISARTRALLPVHLHGQMVDMRRIHEIAARRGLAVVEEASHGIEASRDEVRPGALSDAACFNFYTTSTLSCGKGGALVLADEKVAAALRRRRQHGIIPRERKEILRRGAPAYDVVEVGPEEDLDDLRATLLLAQLPRLESWHARRLELARRYDEAFRDHGQIYAPPPAAGSVHARQAYPLRVRRRPAMRQHLKAKGIGNVAHVPAVTRLSYYREYFFDLELPRATAIGDETLMLPLHPRLSDDDQAQVIEAVLEAIRHR